MQSQIYEGKTAAMRTNTTWLASEDIMDAGDVTVTIEAVYRHQNAEFEGGRKEKEIFALKFRGAEKQLVLNSTNRKTLVAMFGNHTKSWAGQKVVLYVDHKVKAFGEIRNGIRIRLDRSKRLPQAKEEPPTVQTPAGFDETIQAEPDPVERLRSQLRELETELDLGSIQSECREAGIADEWDRRMQEVIGKSAKRK